MPHFEIARPVTKVTIFGGRYEFARPKFLARFHRHHDISGLLVAVKDGGSDRQAYLHLDFATVRYIMKGRTLDDDDIVNFAKENEAMFDKLVLDLNGHIPGLMEFGEDYQDLDLDLYGKVRVYHFPRPPEVRRD